MLGELNNAVKGAEQGLQMPLPPFINGIRGFHVVVKDAKMAGGKPSSVVGSIVLAANDPKALIATAKQMGGPAFANFNLNDDGKPVAFPMPLPPEVMQIVGAIHVAMKGNAIAASVGKGEEKNLGAALGAKPGSPAPLLSFSYDAKKLTSLTEGTMGADEKAIVQALTGLMGTSRTTVTFTAKGLEMQQTTWFN